MSHTTANTAALRRSEVWSSQLKEVIKDELQGTGYVQWLSEFPDGDQFTIPSIGEATVRDYTENSAVVYDALDTGEFAFTVNKYKSSATYITKKALQDGFYMNQLVASFIPKQARALMETLETDIFALGAAGASGGQTAASLNAINGVGHRFVGTGGSDAIAVADFARARYALKKANIPDQGLVAIVDPSVEYTINTLSNIVDVSNNPRWEGLITEGIASGMSFVKNVYGFDVYTSNYLASAGADQSGSETVDSNSVTNGVCNLFFSTASPELLPFMGAWRQMPEVDGEYNKDFQREEHVTTARYGLKVYRPENLVVCITDTTVVS